MINSIFMLVVQFNAVVDGNMITDSIHLTPFKDLTACVEFQIDNSLSSTKNIDFFCMPQKNV